MTHELPMAHKMPYWGTGRSSPDVWIERTKDVIRKLGGANIQEAFGAADGRAAFMLRFEVGGETFKIVWPVLKVRHPKDEPAARVQAATLLYHDCKARAVSAAVLGTRTMFFHALELPGGKTVSEIATPELAHAMPKLPLLAHLEDDDER